MNYISLPIILFYLLIISRYKINLISYELRRLFDESILLDHVVGLLTMYVFIILVRTPSSNNNIIDNFYYSIVCYIIFILSTRLELPVLLILIILGIISFHIDNRIINANTYNVKNKYIKYRKWLNILMIFILITGYIYYTVIEIRNKGSNFNIYRHIFGKIEKK